MAVGGARRLRLSLSSFFEDSWLADADDQVLQSVVGTWDGKNAYPSVSRAAMLDAVRSACPQLLPLFLLAYGGPRRMVWGRRSPGKHRTDVFVCEEGTVGARLCPGQPGLLPRRAACHAPRPRRLP